MVMSVVFPLVPSKVRELRVRKTAASKFAYSLTWKPPASPNGIIRFYEVCTIQDNNNNTQCVIQYIQ